MKVSVGDLFCSIDNDAAGDNRTVYDSIIFDEEEDDRRIGLHSVSDGCSLASDNCHTDSTIVEMPLQSINVPGYVGIQCKLQQ